MVRLQPEQRAAYSEAYERWRRDLDALHGVLLDGAPMDPMHFVALLRRESKSKQRYDEARARFLGLPGDDGDPFGDAEEG